MQMNIAKKDWHWQFDSEQNRLVICSSDEVCYVTALRKAQLNGDALQRQPLSLDDLSFLHSALEILTEQCGLDDDNAMHHAMNAVSARRFFKPVQPQSWHFLPSSAHLTLSELMLVELDTTETKGLFLVLEQEDSTALIMLVTEELSLSGHKMMKRGEVMRVMEDRIARYASNSTIQQSHQRLRA